jgi:hypothetical protein
MTADLRDVLADSLLAGQRPPDFEGEIPDVDDREAPPLEETFAEWTIADLDNATWAARHLNRRLDRLAAIRAHAEQERARVDEWELRESERLNADVAFFTGRLEAFHHHALEVDPRNAKTVRLPDGTELRSQAGKLAVEVTDLEAFTAWCELNELADDLLRYKSPEAEKARIASLLGAKAAAETEPGTYPAMVDESGETVPGVEIVRKPRTYTISPPERRTP